jgi:hypothetical protein
MYRCALLVALILSVAAGTARGQERTKPKADSLVADSSGVGVSAASLLRRPCATWFPQPPGLRPVATTPSGFSLLIPTRDEGPRFIDALSVALATQVACGDEPLCRNDLGRVYGQRRLDADLVAGLLVGLVGADNRPYDWHIKKRRTWP